MRQVVALLVLGTLLGCSAGTLVDANSSTGSYLLKFVGGAPLPYFIGDGPPRTTLTRGSLTVTTSGTWSESRSYEQTENGQSATVTQTDAGNWFRSGAAGIVLVSVSGAEAYSGAFTGLELRLKRPGAFSGTAPEYVFAK